jgi:hypothetical protein
MTKPLQQKTLRIEMPSLNISMQPIEFDRDIMPAVKLQVACTVRHPTGDFTYQADDVWIDYEALDNFIGNLGSLRNRQDQVAALTCIDKAFKLELSRQKATLIIRLSIAEKQPGQKETLLTAAFEAVDDSFVDTWYRSFLEFRG